MIKTTDQEQFASVACTSLSFNWNHTAIHIKFTRDNWLWILIGDDRNLSMHRQGLMRFKNSFSLLSLKVKKLFLPLFCKIFISVFSIWTAKNIFFFFFLKSTYHDTLNLENCFLYLLSTISQFFDFFRCILFDFIFYCVTAHTLYIRRL